MNQCQQFNFEDAYSSIHYVATLLSVWNICATNNHVICSVCRNHHIDISSFMTYHCVCNKSNTTGTTRGAGTANNSQTIEFIHVKTVKVLEIKKQNQS